MPFCDCGRIPGESQRHAEDCAYLSTPKMTPHLRAEMDARGAASLNDNLVEIRILGVCIDYAALDQRVRELMAELIQSEYVESVAIMGPQAPRLHGGKTCMSVT